MRHARLAFCLALACAALAPAARADGGTVFDVSIDGATIRVWGEGLVRPACNPALGGRRTLVLFLGLNELQVVAASSNPAQQPSDYLQGVMPAGAAQLAPGSYLLEVQCGRGTPDFDQQGFTVFVDYAQQDIAKEMARAETAEASISATVAGESSRAVAAEATLQGALDEANGSLTGVQSQLDQTNGSVAGLQATTSQLSTQLGQANAALANQQAQLGALQAQLQALQQSAAPKSYVAFSPFRQIAESPANASCAVPDGNGGCIKYTGQELTRLNLPAGTYLLLAVVPVLNGDGSAQYGECAIDSSRTGDQFRNGTSLGNMNDARQFLDAKSAQFNRAQLVLSDVQTFAQQQTVILSCAGLNWEINAAMLVALPLSL